MANIDHTDHTSSWEGWEALIRRRDTDPAEVMAEFLRERGWIVEKPDTIVLPVQVTSSGGFTHDDGYRLNIHTRVRIGEKLAQVDASVDLRHSDIAARGLVGPTAKKFERLIMGEVEPQIAMGFERELARAKEHAA